MVRDDTQGHIGLIVLPVFCLRDAAHMVSQSLDRIDIEHGVHALHDTGQALQPHAGIYILLLQLCIVIVAVIVELGKYIVPDLHIAVTFTSHRTIRTATAIFRSPVIIYLRTRSTRPGAMFPEVVFFSKTENPFRRDAYLLIPNLPCLIIVQIDGRIQPVRFKSYHFCQELPRPPDRFLLEIITEREVPKHLKKRSMSGGLAYVLNIARTDTLLTCGNPLSRRNLLACKIWLQRRHT